MQKKQLAKSDIENHIKDCAGTLQGKVLLFWLMTECGYDRNLMNSDPNITQALASKRGVYAKLRNLIESEDLIDVEHKLEYKQEVKKGKKNG